MSPHGRVETGRVDIGVSVVSGVKGDSALPVPGAGAEFVESESAQWLASVRGC